MGKVSQQNRKGQIRTKANAPTYRKPLQIQLSSLSPLLSPPPLSLISAFYGISGLHWLAEASSWPRGGGGRARWLSIDDVACVAWPSRGGRGKGDWGDTILVALTAAVMHACDIFSSPWIPSARDFPGFASSLPLCWPPCFRDAQPTKYSRKELDVSNPIQVSISILTAPLPTKNVRRIQKGATFYTEKQRVPQRDCTELIASSRKKKQKQTKRENKQMKNTESVMNK